MAESPTSGRSKPLVFVVDDSDICLDLVADSLEEAGFEVETYNRPLGVTRKIVERRPDIVVLDIGMPALEGPSLAVVIQRNRMHACPILLHTDRERAELIATIRACGADGGAIKSPDSAELIDVIRTVLSRRS